MLITVFTPTYNRAHTLKQVYDSLCLQMFFDFEWLIIDDGSTDNTKSLIDTLILRCKKFPIQYYYQENAGKASAINYAAKLANGEFFLFMDSDDYFTPNGIALLIPYLESIRNDVKFSGITALKIYPDGLPIGSFVPNPILDENYLSFREKRRIKGDYSDIVKTEILRKYPFPRFENEKFCTEALVFNQMAHSYISRYVNVKLTVCEYLPGGLTDTYERIMKDSPQSSALYYKELYQSNLVPWKLKVEYLVKYWEYYIICIKRKRGEGINFSEMIMPTFGMFLRYPVYYSLLRSYRYLKKK